AARRSDSPATITPSRTNTAILLHWAQLATDGAGHDRRMLRDTRICFVGDSFVAGAGDRSALGWTGRLVADAHACGHPVTAYNLGVRGQTSTQIRARWLAESLPRFPDDVDARVVFSLGVNDTTIENGRTRVAAADSVANLTALLAEAADRGWPALVVAPPPV